MARRWWKVSLALLVAACAVAFAQPAQAQVAVVTVRSVDALTSDVTYLLTMAGQEERAKQLDGIIKSVTGGQGLAGIDTKRPLGFYVSLPANVGDQPPIVGFVPVTKEEDFINLLTKVNVEVGAPKNGLYAVTAPNGERLFMRFANKYAYAAQLEEHLAGKLPDPATLMPVANKNSTIAAVVRFDQIPKEYKQLFMQEFEKELVNQKQKQPGETEAEYQGRVAGMKMAEDAIKSFVNDSKELSLSVEIDQKKNNLALDLALTANANSKLAGSIKNFGAARSMFAGLAQDSAFNLLVHLPLAQDLQQSWAKVIDQSIQDGLNQETDPKKKAQLQKLFKAAEPSLKADVLDFGMAMRGPFKDDKYAFVMGIKLKEGKKLEQLFRESAKDLTADGKAVIKLDQAKAADGTAIHLIQSTEPLDENTKKILGNQDFYLAIQDNAVLLTAGANGLQVMKDALAGLGKPVAGDTAPVQIEVALSKFLPLFEAEQPDLAKAIREVFTGANKDKDRIRLSLQGGNALRLRLDANAELLKVVGKLAPIDQ